MPHPSLNPATVAAPIPFNLPFLAGNEESYVRDALARRELSGDNTYTRRCHTLLRELTGAPHALLTTSCTSALEMAAILCDLEPGDEVIVPSFTFVSTANAFVLRGARPVFVDIRADTLNLDEKLIEAAVTARTKAICVVHYAGIACEMDTICAIGQRRGLRIIEDAAQAIDAAYKGRWLGTIGDAGCFSFHATKNVQCGEGGAFLTARADFGRRAEILREKGTNRAQFYRGQVDKYTWVDIGSSYLPSELNAAVLLAQLEAVAEIRKRRERAAQTYDQLLEPLVERGLVHINKTPADVRPNFHMYYLLVSDLATRTGLLSHLRAQGIGGTFHYVPLHTAPMGQRFGYRHGMLPQTESLSDRLVRLPFYADLREPDQVRVVDAMRSYFRL